MDTSTRSKLDRRTLLIGGGVGIGLVVAWAAWPRTYLPNLTPAPGESLFGAWLKIGTDGHVTVAVPQCEEGQGVYTAMPQIIADELGADWKMVGVEPAPLNPLYANPLAAEELFAAALGPLPEALRRAHVRRSGLMLTGASTSIRNFEGELRHAGAAARVLLAKAAAKRWGVDWKAVGTFNGLVYQGNRKLGFGVLAAEAAEQSLPDDVPLRTGKGLGSSASRCRGSMRRPRSTAAPTSPPISGCPTWSMPRSGRAPPARPGWSRSIVPLPTGSAACSQWSPPTIGLLRSPTIGGRRTARSMRCGRASRRPSQWSTAIRSNRR
ncbi:molybdopterin cofactor-binding domain-containing protein [Sphingomonas sp. 7/4-4]|uniref:molybdopterin cofactor-binding domain-containing protein n=1 Tax=Sphingomonas sp. 7/4-4 TaxID=3018446 RepID=UPI003FA7612C